MFYNKTAMNALTEKLSLLNQAADWDLGEEATCPKRAPHRQEDIVLYRAQAGGRRITLFKTLLTSACERDCAYCPFRAGRDFRRASYRPEELAAVFMQLHRQGVAQGLFLSSGIAGGGQRTQDRLLATAEILRRREGYRGYLHLKLMPGADKEQVLRTMQLADRISVNLEAPGARFLQRLAPHKRYWGELLQLLRWVAEIQQEHHPAEFGLPRWPSVTTQFVVGAAGESDRDLLAVAAEWLPKLTLRRVYFSPFRPIPDTPLEHLPPEDPRRAQHLHQAFFLLRDYSFVLEELPLDEQGNLPRHSDPKQAWADAHLREHPVELNTAPKERLLRVPGLGPRRVGLLLRVRREVRLRSVEQLRALGFPVQRMSPYILLDGRRPPQQLRLSLPLEEALPT